MSEPTAYTAEHLRTARVLAAQVLDVHREGIAGECAGCEAEGVLGGWPCDLARGALEVRAHLDEQLPVDWDQLG